MRRRGLITIDHAAHALRRQRTGNVTVQLWRLSSPFFAKIATVVRNVGERRGYRVGVGGRDA